METCRGLPGLKPGVTENALLRFARLPVIVCLFIGTAADTETPTTAFILVHQNNSILTSLIDGTTGTDSETRWVQTVIADTRNIEEDHLLNTEKGLPFCRS
jgi:hypothetical protein